jgi:hypothetical protein
MQPKNRVTKLLIKYTKSENRQNGKYENKEIDCNTYVTGFIG